MAFQTASMGVLHTADMIALFDPRVPGWNEIVLGRRDATIPEVREAVSIEIPVDSTDPTAVQRWRERILRLSRHALRARES